MSPLLSVKCAIVGMLLYDNQFQKCAFEFIRNEPAVLPENRRSLDNG